MQIADYVPTWTKIMLSSANSILQSVFYNTWTESACFTCACHAFLVRHDCLCLSNCTICYGVLHHYQLYTISYTLSVIHGERKPPLLHVYWRVVRTLVACFQAFRDVYVHRSHILTQIVCLWGPFNMYAQWHCQ